MVVQHHVVLFLFGVVHQQVGVVDGVAQRGHAVHAAHADAQFHVGVFGHGGIGHGAADFLQALMEDVFGDLGEHQQKFVAAVAYQNIAAAYAAHNGLYNGAQRGIARRVAVGVIDLLEMVNIDNRHAVGAVVLTEMFLVVAPVRASMYSSCEYCCSERTR